MAAGIVYHNITTATGVTFTIAAWVPDTAAPDVGAIPVCMPVNLTGVPLWRAEDSGHTSGDYAAPIIGVRQDAQGTSLAGTDLDYAPPQFDAYGNLRVTGPALLQATATFNRPANTTPYSINDAVNDNATAGGGSSTLMSFTIAQGRGTIRRVRIRKSDQTVFTPTLRLWLYQATLTQTAGDNEAFTHPVADCIGPVDVAVTNAGTDDAVGFIGCDIPFVSGAVKAQLQTLSAFTPASQETFTVDFWYLPG